jgi:phenylalanyl-tRNA synthetase beta chain
MLEYGHPLHAFDKRFVEGGQIVVRNAKNGEQITLLDGNTVTLDEDTLIIASGQSDTTADGSHACGGSPLAVAGVMGGEFSGVVDDTVEVIFEAACFDGISVRQASRKIGRRTESSSRFEKGLNPVNVRTALLRALQLVEELGIGEVADTLVDIANYTDESMKIPHDCKFVNASLGTDISHDEQVAIFERLGLGYENNAVIVPSHRSDLKLPCDLVEEIARIHGYNNIAPTLPLIKKISSVNQSERSIPKLANILVKSGCYECITYSFVPSAMASENAVKIRNPFGEETSTMRTR